MKGLAVLLVALLVWAAGLMAFAQRVVTSTPAADPPAADGVVALTGGSDVRLETAGRLLEEGKARRMLVSGVNPRLRRAELLPLTGAARRTFDCCVDLGFTAADTKGNARETARWAKAMHIRSLILVTADYHMPRALLELRSALPGVRIIPYAVATSDLKARDWEASWPSAKRMMVEYCKYLAVLVRERVMGEGR
ncbi:MAG: YdcF family protein [Caulobacteraceae bacterium]